MKAHFRFIIMMMAFPLISSIRDDEAYGFMVVFLHHTEDTIILFSCHVTLQQLSLVALCVTVMLSLQS